VLSIQLLVSFFVNTPSFYVVNQQLQWAAHVVSRVASTYLNVEAQIVLLCEVPALRTELLLHEAPEYIGAHRTIRHVW